MSKKILLADDSITIQKVISITFASEDYELIIVGDGDTAVRKAKETKPDLVLADVAMPGKNGYEVSEALKNDPVTSKIPVMLLAGTFEPLNKNEAARVKADDSIVKPFESQELLDKVRTLLVKGEAAAEPLGAARDEAMPAQAGTKPAVAEDIWEAGDFMGFTEEFAEKPDFKEPEAPDLSFLEGGLFEEPHKELSAPHEDFTDLEFREEDFKPKEAPKAAPAPKAEERAASYEPPVGENFDIVEPFDFKTDEIKAEPFEAEPFHPESFVEAPAKEASKKPFWAETEREPEAVKAPSEAVTEPDLLEVPQEDIAAEEAIEFVEPAEEPGTPFKGYAEQTPAAAAEVSEARVAAAVEKAAGRVEERLRADLTARTESRVASAVEGVVGRLESRFRSDLDSRLKTAEAEITRAIEGTAARVEERLRDDLGARLEKSVAVPKEEIADIVRRVAKEVIEQVAWEVIPDLAEELIKAEINRVKEAIIRSK
ncbi:MAG: response regulator [Deltaproteobacteria bacterium]|nr:response regulator [Deltaproteobacteria bacterium]